MLQTISTCLILVAFSRSHSPLAGSGGRSGLSQPQALAPSTVLYLQTLLYTPAWCLPCASLPSSKSCQEMLALPLVMSPYPASHPLPLAIATETALPPPVPSAYAHKCVDGTNSTELISIHGFCPQLFRTIILL